MKYDDLLQAGKIKKQRVSGAEIDRALARAERDLKTARLVMAGDWDWGFAIAYNAVLQASRALMFAEGYRPGSHEGHKNTFAFMHIAMGKSCEDLIAYFDRVRNKRNQAIYDVAGMISETEAKNLFTMATDFVARVKKMLGGKK
ncbi:MAG: HEPN domain-containing protein [Deltaproteobacteria bacterium]|nr:HEPN domain-containing protein [Deltaproteobacteria bacterium]